MSSVTHHTLALDSSGSTPWVDWHRDGTLRIVAKLTVADAVGGLSIESHPGQTVGFEDETGATQTSLSVTSALDGLTHEWVIPDAPRGRYRVTYAATSDGSADSAVIDVG